MNNIQMRLSILLTVVLTISVAEDVTETCVELDEKGCVKQKTGSTCASTIVITNSYCVSNEGFMNNKEITSIKFMGTEKAVSIGHDAFNGAENLATFVSSSKGISSLGNSCFKSSGLTHIDVLGTLIIPSNCFENCTKLVSAAGLNLVTHFGAYAFSGAALKEINFIENLQYLGENAFKGNKLETLKMPPSILSIENGVFSDNKDLTFVDYNQNIRVFESIFSGCSKLQKLVGMESVVVIEQNAFKGCDMLESINLYESLLQISDNFETIKNVFFHGDKEFINVKNEFNSKIKVYVKESYQATQFGHIDVIKAKCSTLQYVNITPRESVQPISNSEELLCKTCSDTTMSIDGVNYYCEIDMSLCISTHLNCRVCKDDICQQCKDNYYVKDRQTCVETCGDKYYSVESPIKICLECPENCKTCSDGTTCNACDDGKLLIEDTKKCTENADCPSNYYKDNDNKKCVKCKNNCLTCENENKCLSCVDGYVISEDQCISCSSIQGCSKCSSSDICTECTTDNLQPDNKSCLPTCPTGYYSSNKVCMKCSDNCDSCKDGKQCDKCKTDYLLTEDTKVCVVTCSDGYFKSTQEKMCKTCQEGCKRCATKKDCEECMDNMLKEEETNLCVDQCKDGYFQHEKQCKKCGDKCQKCHNKTSCDVCEENVYLQNGTCVEICQDNYFESNRQCEKCKDKNTYKTPCTNFECEVCTGGQSSATRKYVILFFCYASVISNQEIDILQILRILSNFFFSSHTQLFSNSVFLWVLQTNSFVSVSPYYNKTIFLFSFTSS
ncbi:hypothetical protein EIN_440760 [Entamoeba invadens IP1]|uniref:EGF-like domain-containing protein n=1 Tax=Entamoeba invadens IP1 TaxID=370355 RepID=A0A0A1TUU2_ENTIV|nr:hypothetical protein EIN_440760 [Entamoeba invadens IP1]ELP83902.1 hypothetical protein EIN_440760 [Entamoeba invadens IP1]|eukprot:XP_004183248.1 hypothetical protein EIN_440760 [Entamoeba invadens IP1]